MARYRKTDTSVQSEYKYTDYNPYTGAVTKVTTVVLNNGTRRSGTLKEITDTPNKGYFKARQDGLVVLNPVTIREKTYESVGSTFTIGPHPNWGPRVTVGDNAAAQFRGPSGPKFIKYADDLASAKDLALIEAYAKMNSPDVLLSVLYKEREKTAAMIRRPLQGASDLLEKIFARKARLVSRGLGAAQASAQAWLELRFGWRPLMYDIAGIAKAATHEKPIAGRLLVARGGKDISYKDSLTAFDAYNEWKATHDWSIKDRVSAGVLYSYRDLTEAEWKMRCLGLTLDNVPSHFWEVIPLSWVADYFVKVGLWLRAITPNPDVIVRGNWVSQKQETDYVTSGLHLDVFIGTNPATTFHIDVGGSYRETTRTLDRVVNQSLSMTPPRAVTPLSFPQTVDLAALIFGRVSQNLGRLRL